MVYIHTAFFICPSVSAKNRPGFLLRKPRRFIMLYSCFLKPSRDYLRGFLIAAWERVPKLQGVGHHSSPSGYCSTLPFELSSIGLRCFFTSSIFITRMANIQSSPKS